MDIDYVDGVYNSKNECVIRPLNESEKLFLNNFMEEVINGDFKHTNKIYKKAEDRRQLWRENNARNRCAFNKAKTTGNLFEYVENRGGLDDSIFNDIEHLEGNIDSTYYIDYIFYGGINE